MKKLGLLVVAAMMLLAFAGFGTGRAYAQGAANQVTIQLNEENGSGESGTATLAEQNGQLMVTLNLANGPAGTPQPAHIHQGTCANLNPVPYVPLSNVVDGKSSTTIDLMASGAKINSLNALTSGQYAINVHKSAAEATVYVACGDIVNTQLSSGTGGPGAGTGGTTGGTTTGGTTTGGTTTGGTTTGTTTAPGMPATGAGDQTLPLIALALLGIVAVTAGFKFRLANR